MLDFLDIFLCAVCFGTGSGEECTLVVCVLLSSCVFSVTSLGCFAAFPSVIRC